jgi:hypothetical protein
MHDDESIFQHIEHNAAVPGHIRLGIYHNAYRARLVEALASDFEQLQKLLGSDAFEQIAHDYIDVHPSRHTSLRWFGQHLSQHLGYTEEQGSHLWPAEMARLEWLFTEAFDARDEAVIHEGHMATVPPEAWATLCFRFHPAVRRLILWWNTLARWRAAKEDEAIPEAQRLTQPVSCVMWRDGLRTQFRSVEPHEAVALSAAMDGQNFSDICGVLAAEMQDPEQVPMTVAGFLKGWLNAGLIAAIDD